MYTNESIKMTRLILGNKKCPYVCTQPVYTVTVYIQLCVVASHPGSGIFSWEKEPVYRRLHVFCAMGGFGSSHFLTFFSHAEGISSLAPHAETVWA